VTRLATRTPTVAGRPWRRRSVTLSPGAPSACGTNYARSCPANRLIALCQSFWDEPAEQPGTVLHEPFHVLFTMRSHDASQPRLADASCFEAFARRLAGETPPFTCAGKAG